jgi:hypothetical protein
MKIRGFTLWVAGAALGLGGAVASAATVDCPTQPSAAGPDYITLTFSAPVSATCYDYGADGGNNAQYSVGTVPVILDNNILELPTGSQDFTPLSNFLSGTFDSGTSGTFEFLIGSANPLWLVLKTGGGQNDPYWFAFQLTGVTIGTEVSWALHGDTPLNGLSNTHLFGSDFVVPLPAAAWLFGSGLLGLLGIARRRKVEVAA